jgi:hypothetical protein
MAILRFRKAAEPVQNPAGWSNQELAEFYRVVELLGRAGITVDVDGGVSDEGDPWFIFARADGGEVVAHFARVNGFFIAVSSFNHELYKAKDLRGVLDKMLDRHPFLLPQSPNGGKVFVHPAAALTAFVAAALLLSVDNANATDILDVIDSIKEETVNSDAADPSIELRQELARLISAEFSLGGYSVAVFGAVLIPSDITGPADLLDQNGISSNSQRLNIEELDAITSDQNWAVFSPNKFDQYKYASGIEVQKIGETTSEVALGSGSGNAYQTHQAKIASSDAVAELVSNVYTESEGKFPLFGEALSVPSFDGGHYQQETDLSLLDVNTDLIENNLFSQDESLIVETELTIIIEAVYEVFRKAIPIVEEGGAREKSGLGFAVGSAGELVVVALDQPEPIFSSQLTDLISVPGSFAETVAMSIEGTDFLNLLGEEQDINFSETVPESPHIVVEVLPIVGHDLSKLGSETIYLTDAIDVIFYSGDAHQVSGFELGKDLLWFFVEPEELNKSLSSIENESDLLLGFGELGTLTLLGVLGTSDAYDLF